jgi:hypothetical protein
MFGAVADLGYADEDYPVPAQISVFEERPDQLDGCLLRDQAAARARAT